MFSPLFLFGAEMKIKHGVWVLGKHFAMELQSYLENTSYEGNFNKSSFNFFNAEFYFLLN